MTDGYSYKSYSDVLKEMAKQSDQSRIDEMNQKFSEMKNQPRAGMLTGPASSSELPMEAFAKPTQSQAMAASMSPQSPGIEKAALAGGTTMAMTGNPYLAAAMVGGQLLSQSMANQAQAEQARRQREMQILGEKGAGEQRGIDQMLTAWRSSLR